MKKNNHFLNYLWVVIYIAIFLGFVFHTSSPQCYRLFNKYSISYFIFLILLVTLFGFVYLKFERTKKLFLSETLITTQNHTIKINPLIKITAFLFMILLSFGIIEYYLSIQAASLRLAAFHPFLQTKQIASERRFHINSLGFRGEEITKEKPKNTIRIFLVGGSSIYGETTEYEYTHARILEELLQNQYPDKKIEVLNAGYHWYTTEHSLIDYLFRIRDFNPDIIIMMQGINDLCRSFSPTRFAFGQFASDYSHYFGSVSNLVFNKGIFQMPLFIDKIITFFKFNFFSDFRVISEFDAPVYREVIVKEFPSLLSFARNTQLIIDVLRRDNITLILATQPTIYRSNLNKTEKKKIVFPALFCSIEKTMPTIDSMVYGMQLFNATTKEIANKNLIYLIDLDVLVPKNLDYFRDDCHYTRKGHEIIGKALFDLLISKRIIIENR